MSKNSKVNLLLNQVRETTIEQTFWEIINAIGELKEQVSSQKKNSHSQLATKSSTWNGCWVGEDIPQARSKRSRVTKNGQNSQLWTCYWIEYLKRLLRWLLRSHTISEVKKESSNKKIQKFSKTNSLLNWRCETSIELTFAQQHQTWGQEGDEYPKIVKILKS